MKLNKDWSLIGKFTRYCSDKIKLNYCAIFSGNCKSWWSSRNLGNKPGLGQTKFFCVSGFLWWIHIHQIHVIHVLDIAIIFALEKLLSNYHMLWCRGSWGSHYELAQYVIVLRDVKIWLSLLKSVTLLCWNCISFICFIYENNHYILQTDIMNTKT